MSASWPSSRTRRAVTTPARYPEIHVLVPERRQVRSVEFVHVERTMRPPDSGDPRRQFRSRRCALLHGCRTPEIRSSAEVTELLSDAVQQGLCTVAALSEEVEAGSRRGTAVPRAVLADVAVGVGRRRNGAAKQLWPSTGFPSRGGTPQCWTRRVELLGYGDCWLDEVAMLWEIESTEWHLSPAAHEYTVRRAAMFTAAGVVYVASKPKMVLQRLAPGGRDAPRRPTPKRRARPRPSLRATARQDMRVLAQTPHRQCQESHLHDVSPP